MKSWPTDARAQADTPMTDVEREAEIDRCARFITDATNGRDARREVCAIQAALIAGRSAAQVAEMERERFGRVFD